MLKKKNNDLSLSLIFIILKRIQMIKLYIKRFIFAILFFAGVFLFYKLLKLTELKNDLLSVTIALVTVYIAYKQYCVEASKNRTSFLKEKIILIDDLSLLMEKIQKYEISLDKRKVSIRDITNEIYKLDIKITVLFNINMNSEKLINLIMKKHEYMLEYDMLIHPRKKYKNGTVRFIEFDKNFNKSAEENKVLKKMLDNLNEIDDFHKNLLKKLLKRMKNR